MTLSEVNHTMVIPSNNDKRKNQLIPGTVWDCIEKNKVYYLHAACRSAEFGNYCLHIIYLYMYVYRYTYIQIEREKNIFRERERITQKTSNTPWILYFASSTSYKSRCSPLETEIVSRQKSFHCTLVWSMLTNIFSGLFPVFFIAYAESTLNTLVD